MSSTRTKSTVWTWRHMVKDAARAIKFYSDVLGSFSLITIRQQGRGI